MRPAIRNGDICDHATSERCCHYDNSVEFRKEVTTLTDKVEELQEAFNNEYFEGVELLRTISSLTARVGKLKDEESATQAKYEAVCFENDTLKEDVRLSCIENGEIVNNSMKQIAVLKAKVAELEEMKEVNFKYYLTAMYNRDRYRIALGEIASRTCRICESHCTATAATKEPECEMCNDTGLSINQPPMGNMSGMTAPCTCPLGQKEEYEESNRTR